MARIELADKVIDSAGMKLLTCLPVMLERILGAVLLIAYNFCSHLCLKYEHNLSDLSAYKAFWMILCFYQNLKRPLAIVFLIRPIA